MAWAAGTDLFGGSAGAGGGGRRRHGGACRGEPFPGQGVVIRRLLTGEVSASGNLFFQLVNARYEKGAMMGGCVRRADDFMMPPSSKELCVVLVFSTQLSACSKDRFAKACLW
jgi:hypothetical protein